MTLANGDRKKKLWSWTMGCGVSLLGFNVFPLQGVAQPQNETPGVFGSLSKVLSR
jgi:hypothetical protein